MKDLKAFTPLVVPLFVLLVCPTRVRADEIGGEIHETRTIYQDSELVDDVRCFVPLTTPGANPCISFGADYIKLRLNGHTITGQIIPPTDCSLPTDSMFGVGIGVIDRTGVKIEGPGIIQHFQRWGILVGFPGHPSSHVTMKKVTVSDNCWSGMQTFSTSNSNFEENVFVDDAGGSNGASCGGT